MNVTAKAAKGVATVIKADVAATAAAVAVVPKAEIAPVVTPRAPKVNAPAAKVAANSEARAAVKAAVTIVAVAKAIAAAVALVAVEAGIVANEAPAVIAAVPIPAPKASKAAARSDRVSVKTCQRAPLSAHFQGVPLRDAFFMDDPGASSRFAQPLAPIRGYF